MRTRNEVIEHLGLDEVSDLDELWSHVFAAQYFELIYRKKLKSENYDYHLSCDFVYLPHLIVDQSRVASLEPIRELNGVVFYKINWIK